MSTSQYPSGPPSYPAPGGQPGAAPQGYGGYAGAPVAPQGYAPTTGPIGQVRGTGMCILLCVVTLGIYSLVWYFKVHDEMKKHTGDGLGGPLALVLALFIGVASPYLASMEVGNMQERAGRTRTVSGATGLWYFPGIFIIVGPIVWFVKTNNALNEYWRSLGAH